MSLSSNELRGQRSLITGAGGGIGAAAARRLCDAGHTAHPLPLDVTDAGDVAAKVAEAAGLLGGLDCLVANAGILTVAPIEELTPEAFRRTLEVNLVGTFLPIRHAVPRLREAGSSAIVCVASQSGNRGRPGAERLLRIQVRRGRTRPVARPRADRLRD
jgi:NAD(P)-dependent dehydrogenase (short-subunit alcohol dehydrogenase family)